MVQPVDEGVMRFLGAGEILATQRVERPDAGVVHVWPFELGGPEPLRRRCTQLLSATELERAGRFVFEKDRNAFVFARGLMKHLLGLYCGTAGGDIELAVTSSGKPLLAAAHPAVAFNLSHSGGRGLLAVTSGAPVGVDLERVDARTDALAIAERYFFGLEHEAISQAPAASRQDTFFAFWTAKEAVLKAHGSGLSVPLDKFQVSFSADGATAEVQSFDTAVIAAGWFVRAIRCEPGWRAAVVARSQAWRVERMGQSGESREI